ncbi:HD domain-containing protein [Aerococcaceae bacterium DSM 111022]|nr:HD domain-containing protein [Aerococcaceae bacterium DSM 111022]
MTLLYDVEQGAQFGIFVLIKAADLRTARNGNPFIAFRFQDKSGAMDGMFWSATPEQIETFQAGRVVFLKGRRDTYNGTPQVKIEALRLAESDEPNDPKLYVESIEESADDLREALNDFMYRIHEPNISRVVRRIVQEHNEDFFAYPAAKRMHHAVAGGLSLHTVTMLRIADQLVKIYPELNESLLFGGIILHDIGKTIELSGVLSTEYTLRGKLQGHIIIMDELIDRASIQLGINPDENEPIILLKHVVLAHHGKQEYGSPVLPQLMEAEIIHYIDDMDAKMNMISSALGQTEKGDFSAQIFALDRRQIYKPTFN